MSILINGYTSSWSVATTFSNNNIRKIQIPSGYDGRFIYFSSPYLSSGRFWRSADYGQTFSAFGNSDTDSDFSVKAAAEDQLLFCSNNYITERSIWVFYSDLDFLFGKNYVLNTPGRPPEYFSGCAMNSDPFHPYDGTYGEYPDQWPIFGLTSGLSVGGRIEGLENWVAYDAIGGLGEANNKLKYYSRNVLSANVAGIRASFANYGSGSYTLISILPTTNTYVFGESGESLNDVDYNTDSSTDPDVGYTTNNVYEARGTAKRICSSEDNSHQIVYYVDNVTYGTGFVLFNERNFVKKINIPPFTFSNSSVVDGSNNASIGMSYNGQIQAIGAGNKLYVSRNYGL